MAIVQITVSRGSSLTQQCNNQPALFNSLLFPWIYFESKYLDYGNRRGRNGRENVSHMVAGSNLYVFAPYPPNHFHRSEVVQESESEGY